MPVANASSIANPLSAWVLRTACQQARRWERAGFSLRIAVNLSPSQFEVGDLASSVDQALRDSNLKADLLELEVTENIFLDSTSSVLNMLDRIRSLGVRVVFDDFGTGYASLAYLKKFPIDGLKIDRSFVMGLVRDADDAAIVESTISLSKKLKLAVIAEGIEDGATAALLLALGCEEGQGYYFGKPMPASEFTTTFLTDEPRQRSRQITAAKALRSARLALASGIITDIDQRVISGDACAAHAFRQREHDAAGLIERHDELVAAELPGREGGKLQQLRDHR
jgi:EAL domain-containing protein (putative c-di-GMP-specific phosphodiesterase class I)